MHKYGYRGHITYIDGDYEAVYRPISQNFDFVIKGSHTTLSRSDLRNLHEFTTQLLKEKTMTHEDNDECGYCLGEGGASDDEWDNTPCPECGEHKN